MSRLKGLSPTVQRLAPQVSQSPTDEGERSRYRDKTQHWRAWYKTARWRRLRWAQLVFDTFTCRRCGQAEHDTSKLVCDHVEAHRGNAQRFWAGPFQTLCKPCHDVVKQREEQQQG